MGVSGFQETVSVWGSKMNEGNSAKTLCGAITYISRSAFEPAC